MTKYRRPDWIDALLYSLAVAFVLSLAWGYPVRGAEHAALDANGNIAWPTR